MRTKTIILFLILLGLLLGLLGQKNPGLAKDNKNKEEKQVAKVTKNVVTLPPKVEKGLIKEEKRQELSLTEKAKLVALNLKDDTDPILHLNPPTKGTGMTIEIVFYHKQDKNFEASVRFQKRSERAFFFRGKNYELKLEDNENSHGEITSAKLYYKNNVSDDQVFKITKKLCLNQPEVKKEVERIFGLILDYIIYGQEPTARELLTEFDLEKFYQSQIKNQVLAKIQAEEK